MRYHTGFFLMCAGILTGGGKNIAEVRTFIRELCELRGKTILISGNIPSESALLAYDIGIINHGILQEEESLAQLEENNRDLWHYDTDLATSAILRSFLENGLLRSIDPFLAPFVVIGFDTADDNGAQLPGNRWIGAASLAVMALAAAVLIRYSRTPEMKEKKKGLEKREGRPLC